MIQSLDWVGDRLAFYQYSNGRPAASGKELTAQQEQEQQTQKREKDGRTIPAGALPPGRVIHVHAAPFACQAVLGK